MYVYPGPLGEGGVGTMVQSVRLQAQRDGVEDWHVFFAAGEKKGRAAVEAAVRTLVTTPTSFSTNATLLQSVKRMMLSMASE